MSELKFDNGKKYQDKGDIFFDDGREIALLHWLYGRPNLDSIRNNPSKVLAAIDEFARTQRYLMNVGEHKGAIISRIISKRRPRVMVELGGYVGYSTILFGAAVRDAGGLRYWALERNPEFAAVIASLVDLAGLSEVVKVVVGSSHDSLKRLHSTQQLKNIDMLFLDHYKPAYTTDLKLCEELSLVVPGTLLAADNVITPGNPPYLEYVRSTCEEKLINNDSKPNGHSHSTNGIDARFAERAVNQYEVRQGPEILEAKNTGNPLLIYQSELIHSFEPNGDPDGVEITRCVGIEERQS